MRYTVSEIAKLTGVSVRTLHYYDEIGLLKPGEVILDTGYRYYTQSEIEQLQQILFFRELDFPLKEIKTIMTASNYNKQQALKNQKELLVLKKNRLENLIMLLDSNLKGDKEMSFKEFDMTEIEEAKERYAKEVKEKWGDTNAYKEYNEKQSNFSKSDYSNMMKKSDMILSSFAKHVGKKPECKEVQKLVEEWKNFISEYYYTCTKEILAGLGEMYVSDERFTKNMDKFSVGTAKLVSDGIREYCKR